jgi:hypothetical protein
MWILTAGQYAAAISAIVVLVGIFIKWAIVKPIKIYIDQATYPIHPDANGGRSLPDAVAGISRIETRICLIEERLNNLENIKAQRRR